MAVTLREFQDRIRDLYGAKDAARGVEGTFLWFTEEVGELAAALRAGPKGFQPWKVPCRSCVRGLAKPMATTCWLSMAWVDSV